MYDHILIRYGEINTKGQNRGHFERLLQDNVRYALRAWPEVRVKRVGSRMVVKLHDAPIEEILDHLKRVFGISSFSPVRRVALSVPEMTAVVVDMVRDYMVKNHSSATLTFKVDARRGNKNFELNSMELAAHLGAEIVEHIPNLKVDVHHPSFVVGADVRDEGIYLFVERQAGASGFPVGMSGRVVGLLSGGIDSPVAIWKAMKRGLDVDLVHFHSFPFTSERAQRKVEDLTSVISRWSKGQNLYFVSVTEIQSEIQKKTPDALRTILLRRMMFRIVSAMANDQHWMGLVTGDSVGQVASQTLEGLYVVDEATSLTVLRPLVTADKVEIVDTAKQIETYPISIQPFDDCCSLFAPKRPKTRPTLNEVIEAERALSIDDLVASAIGTMEHKFIEENEGNIAVSSFQS